MPVYFPNDESCFQHNEPEQNLKVCISLSQVVGCFLNDAVAFAHHKLVTIHLNQALPTWTPLSLMNFYSSLDHKKKQFKLENTFVFKHFIHINRSNLRCFLRTLGPLEFSRDENSNRLKVKTSAKVEEPWHC